MAQVMARKKASKKAYKPFVRIVSRPAGLYTVQSETYKYVLYLVDALAQRCECTASSQFGKTCKHVRAARFAHEVLTHEAERAAVRSDLVERFGGAAGLQEAFGA